MSMRGDEFAWEQGGLQERIKGTWRQGGLQEGLSVHGDREVYERGYGCMETGKSTTGDDDAQGQGGLREGIRVHANREVYGRG